MSRDNARPHMVGNEFARPAAVSSQPVRIIQAAPPQLELTPAVAAPGPAPIQTNAFSLTHRELLRRYGVILYALIFLLLSTAAIQVAGRYWADRLANQVPIAATVEHTHILTGLNLSVPSDQLKSKVESITHQPVSLTVGDHVTQLSPETIKSWLQITPDSSGTSHIHIKAETITESLTAQANKFAKTPVNQISTTHDGVSSIIAKGSNGAKLSDPTTLQTQAAAVAKTVMDAKGLLFTTPLETVPFQAVTPAIFPKMIEVNVVTKQMYLYDNGQISHTYPISAGAAATPTPLGQYHIFSKLAVQDMRGFNPNGTKYFQPHVHWISYFLPGGYAVHGNYWRPSSWFGAINSSHGCVSLPDYQAKQVYDWAPVGTTVITHA